MELFAKRMTWELDNEEGLSCLFFELEDGYFTLSRKTGAEALRLEMNDPANGQLIDPAKHRYFPLSSYNGLLREGVEMDSANRSYFREDFAGGKDRTTWFSPNKIWTNCGDKVLNVDIKAANVSENITPREYADLLFDGIGAALVFNFKRLKREEFDGLKPKIDWSIVESFPFPAPFEEQRYIGDEGEIHVYSWDGRKETTLVGPYSVRKLYLEHFRES